MTSPNPSDKPPVWIVLPTLNEANNIVPMLEGVAAAMTELPYVACIVDDGSTDGTLDRVASFQREHPSSLIEVLRRRKMYRGSQRGVAVWTGLQHGYSHSPADVLVEMDADLSHRPEELRTGIDLLRVQGYEVAIASKYALGSQVVNRPWGRRALSFVANSTVRTLISGRVRDYSNGFRFYSRECVGMMRNHRLRYGSPIYLSEVLALLMAHDMRIAEFPATYLGRGEGLSKLRMIDLWKAGIAVFDIAARFHFHRRGFVRGRPDYSPLPVAGQEIGGTAPIGSLTGPPR